MTCPLHTSWIDRGSAGWGVGVILAGRAPLKVCTQTGQWVQTGGGGVQTWWAVGGLAETPWMGLLVSGTLAL